MAEYLNYDFLDTEDPKNPLSIYDFGTNDQPSTLLFRNFSGLDSLESDSYTSTEGETNQERSQERSQNHLHGRSRSNELEEINKLLSTQSRPILPKLEPGTAKNERVPRVTKPRKEKTSHNMIEKRYRNKINDKISILKDCVPSLRILEAADSIELDGLQPAKKLNKATILAKATEYIKHLEAKNTQLAAENARLRSNIEHSSASASPVSLTLSKLVACGIAGILGSGVVTDFENDTKSLLASPMVFYSIVIRVIMVLMCLCYVLDVNLVPLFKAAEGVLLGKIKPSFAWDLFLKDIVHSERVTERFGAGITRRLRGSQEVLWPMFLESLFLGPTPELEFNKAVYIKTQIQGNHLANFLGSRLFDHFMKKARAYKIKPQFLAFSNAKILENLKPEPLDLSPAQSVSRSIAQLCLNTVFVDLTQAAFNRKKDVSGCKTLLSTAHKLTDPSLYEYKIASALEVLLDGSGDSQFDCVKICMEVQRSSTERALQLLDQLGYHEELGALLVVCIATAVAHVYQRLCELEEYPPEGVERLSELTWACRVWLGSDGGDFCEKLDDRTELIEEFVKFGLQLETTSGEQNSEGLVTDSERTCVGWY